MVITGLIPYLISPLLAAACIVFGWSLTGRMHKFATHSFFERLWLYLFLGVVAFSWIGTILAALGAFKIIPMAVVIAVLVGYMRWPWRRKTEDNISSDTPPDRTPWPILVALTLLIVGVVWLYAKPTESFLLTDDSAAYTIGGISLARTGSLWVEPDMAWSGWTPGAVNISAWDPIVTSFDAILNIPQGFLRQFFTEGIVFTRHFGPFYQWSLSNPTMEIGFLALPKVWSAIVTLAFGAGYASYAAPFMGLVGLLAVYMLIRRTLGWPSAWVSIIIMVVSFPQLWFARLSLSEIYTQALFMGGIYLLTLVRRNLQHQTLARQLAVCAGISLAAITVVRFEALVMLLPFAVLMLLAPNRAGWERHGAYRTWLWVLAVASVLGTIVSVATAPYYVFTRLLTAFTPGLLRRLLYVFFGILCLIAAFVGSRQKIKGFLVTILWYIRQHIYQVILALWLAWVVYAVWQAFTRPVGSSLVGWLSQYYTWQGIILAVLGCTGAVYLLSAQRQHYELAAFMGMAVLFLWLYSMNPRVTTLHPWALRRLVPVIIPAIAFGIGAVPWCLNQLLTTIKAVSRKARYAFVTLVALAGTLGVGWQIAQVSRPFVLFQDRAGIYNQLQSLADSLPKKCILLFDDSEASQRLTPVMELVFNRPSLVVYNDSPSGDLPLVDKTVENAHKAGYQVFYVEAGTDPAPWQPTNWLVEPYLSQGIVTRTTQQVWGRPPNYQDVALNTIILEVYEVLAPSQGAIVPGEVITIPVTEGDYSYLYKGFNQLESEASGRIFRWTDGSGQLRIPWPDTGSEPVSACLQLKVSGGRPEGQAPTSLGAEVEGKAVLEQDLPADFSVQTLQIPIDKVQNSGDPSLEITLRSSSFTQTEASAPPITRTLGVLYYGAVLDTNGVCR